MKATAIYCDGPEADIDRDGEEIPVWHVWAGDDDAEQIGPSHTFHSRDAAREYARRTAAARRLELVDESMPA